jgi:hypothetical protein
MPQARRRKTLPAPSKFRRLRSKRGRAKPRAEAGVLFSPIPRLSFLMVFPRSGLRWVQSPPLYPHQGPVASRHCLPFHALSAFWSLCRLGWSILISGRSLENKGVRSFRISPGALRQNGQSQARLGSAILDKDYGSSNEKRRLFKVLGSS